MKEAFRLQGLEGWMRARSALFKKKIPEAVADIIITNPHNFINNYCDC